MKATANLRLTVLIISLLSISNLYSQEPVAKSDKHHESQDCVINIKMVEKFHNSYNNVEVISWQEVLINNSFENAKVYLNAYLNINLEEVAPEELKQAINDKLIETNNALKQGLDKNYPLASNEM